MYFKDLPRSFWESQAAVMRIEGIPFILVCSMTDNSWIKEHPDQIADVVFVPYPPYSMSTLLPYLNSITVLNLHFVACMLTELLIWAAVVWLM